MAETWDDIDLVVCVKIDGKPLLLPDNLVGTCHRCGAPIQFRPYVPAVIPKMCIECATATLEEKEREDP